MREWGKVSYEGQNTTSIVINQGKIDGNFEWFYIANRS